MDYVQINDDEFRVMIDTAWGEWLEDTYDPDNPPWDTLPEQTGEA